MRSYKDRVMKFNIASKILGIPRYTQILKASRLVLLEAVKQGHSYSDIGRALGFKDYKAKTSRGRHHTIQNIFHVRAFQSGFELPSRFLKRSGDHIHWNKKIRNARADLARKTIDTLLKQNKTRNEVILGLRKDFTLSALGMALGISRERVRQIQEKGA